MEMQDCNVCMSAGSVNKWGICEICGEEFHGFLEEEWEALQTALGPAPLRQEEPLLPAAMGFGEAARDQDAA